MISSPGPRSRRACSPGTRNSGCGPTPGTHQRVKGGKPRRPDQNSTEKNPLVDLRHVNLGAIVGDTTSSWNWRTSINTFLKNGNLIVLPKNQNLILERFPRTPSKMEVWSGVEKILSSYMAPKT